MWGTTFNCPADAHQLLLNHDKNRKPPIAQDFSCATEKQSSLSDICSFILIRKVKGKARKMNLLLHAH